MMKAISTRVNFGSLLAVGAGAGIGAVSFGNDAIFATKSVSISFCFLAMKAISSGVNYTYF